MRSIYYELAEKLISDIQKQEEHRRYLSTLATENPWQDSRFSVRRGDDAEENVGPEGEEVGLPSIPEENPIAVISENPTVYAYTRTYTRFSGADLTVSLGDTVIGEVQSVHYFKVEEPLRSLIALDTGYVDGGMVADYPIALVVQYTIFNRNPIPPADAKEDTHITLTYQNEYGQRGVESFTGVRKYGEYGGISIDSVDTIRTTIMIARNHYPMEEVH